VVTFEIYTPSLFLSLILFFLFHIIVAVVRRRLSKHCQKAHKQYLDPKSSMKMTTASTIVLPGQTLTPDQLPQTTSSRTLTLGPGLLFTPPSTITTTIAGTLTTDTRKNALWIESLNSGRYMPSVGDLVIGTIHHSSTDTYHVALTPHTSFALLGQLSFESATKKTRPQLNSGNIVYARVAKTDKWADVELECVSAATGKSDGLGPLKGGMLFHVSLGLARRLMMGAGKGGVVLLEEIGEKIRFEVAIGRNGVVWINAGSVADVVRIGRILKETDEKGLDVVAQKKLVRKMLGGT